MATTMIVIGPYQADETAKISKVRSIGFNGEIIRVMCQADNPKYYFNGVHNYHISDPGALLYKDGKPLNILRWIAQVRCGLENAQNSDIVVYRSDITLKDSFVNSILKLYRPPIWTVCATSLSPLRAGTSYHFCDWVIGGQSSILSDVIPTLEEVIRLNIFDDSPFQEGEHKFYERVRAEQLIFSGVLNCDERSELAMYHRSRRLDKIERDLKIEILPSEEVIESFKGKKYRSRPLLINRIPTKFGAMRTVFWYLEAIINSAVSVNRIVDHIKNKISVIKNCRYNIP